MQSLYGGPANVSWKTNQYLVVLFLVLLWFCHLLFQVYHQAFAHQLGHQTFNPEVLSHSDSFR